MEQSLVTIIRCAKEIFKDSDWAFVDCGAHMGEYSNDVISSLTPKRIIMVEANPHLAQTLEKKFCKDSLKIQILNKALSISEGPVEFHLYPDSATSSLLKDPLNKSSPVAVDSVKLSQILDNIDLPVLLKTDLQGMDFAILNEAISSIKGKVRLCICEFIQYPLYSNQGSTYDLLKLMRDIDFELLQITDLHSKEMGNLAFGNMVFVDKIFMANIHEISVNEQMVPNELFNPYVNSLKFAAEERLELINRLSKQCELLQLEVSEKAWTITNLIAKIKRKIKSFALW